MNVPAFLTKSVYDEPKLIIERQPKKYGYRFRYQSEGSTHGGIPGESCNNERKQNKLFPSVKLVGWRGKAKVVLTLATAEDDHVHPHSLVVDKEKKNGFHIFTVDGNSLTELKSVAIQHVEKENLSDTIMDRMLQSEFLKGFSWNHSSRNVGKNFLDLTNFVEALMDKDDKGDFKHRHLDLKLLDGELKTYRRKAEELSKKIKMNICRLRFQAFLQDQNGHFSRRLDPVFSTKLYDAKTPDGAPLKIIRLSKVTSTVSGDEEVWLLADKLKAEDIEVRFFRENIDSGLTRPWEDFGRFTKTDVYKQVCLIFRTPAYHDLHIVQPVNVWLELRRISDRECVSEPHCFKYTPINDRFGIGEKRKKDAPIDEIFNSSSQAKRFFDDFPLHNILPGTTLNQLMPNEVSSTSSSNIYSRTEELLATNNMFINANDENIARNETYIGASSEQFPPVKQELSDELMLNGEVEEESLVKEASDDTVTSQVATQNNTMDLSRYTLRTEVSESLINFMYTALDDTS